MDVAGRAVILLLRMATLNFQDLLSQVEKLNKDEQLTLLEKIVTLLKRKRSENEPEINLTALNGLGKDIWKGTDIDGYVHEERQW